MKKKNNLYHSLILRLVHQCLQPWTVEKNIYFHGCKEYLTQTVSLYMNNKMKRFQQHFFSA